ncbi:MAG: VOC family protein [Hellea sp.]|nr:VOC family protein [Hellea sp.]
MISYTTVGTNNLEKSGAFYDALFGEIGVGRLWGTDNFIGYAPNMDVPMFGVCKPHNGEAASAGNGTMIALACPNKETVHKIYDKAIELGAQCEGPAGPRGESGFYCGYFRDPDGNKINAFAMVKPDA